MIKINLLKNTGLGAAGTAMTGVAGGSIMSVDIRRQATIKLFIILLMPTILYVYESLNLSTLHSDLINQTARADKLESEIASYGSIAPRVEKANKLKDKIQKEIKTIRELAKNRLREVKALDQLQSVVPQGVWFKKINMTGGRVDLVGHSLSNAAVSELVTALETNVFFSQVQAKGTKESRAGNVPVTDFEISFRVGRQE